jgi:hypothetical protein
VLLISKPVIIDTTNCKGIRKEMTYQQLIDELKFMISVRPEIAIQNVTIKINDEYIPAVIDENDYDDVLDAGHPFIIPADSY